MAGRNWTKWSKDVVEEEHGAVYYYRDLYEGNHAKLFPRAKDLENQGEIVTNMLKDSVSTQNVRTPYLIANIAKLIADVPAELVARSMGKVRTSLYRLQAEEGAARDTEAMIDNPTGEAIEDMQQKIIEQIEKNSNLSLKHWSNMVQHQVDGAIVACPWIDERGPRIDFKHRDVYFAHEDGLGCDLVYQREIEEIAYLHIYREEVINNGRDLQTSHFLYPRKGEGTDQLEEPLSVEEVKTLLGIQQPVKVYPGRTRPFVMYWANEATPWNPLGRSILKNTESLQEEINWTMTRTAIVYERNGKPRIVVPTEVYEELEQKALDRINYDPTNNDGAPPPDVRLDNRDFEITTHGEKGEKLEVVQIDVDKIGDMDRVHDLMVEMLRETRTALKAVDYSEGSGTAGAQSGTAKFYDLLTSIIKAERLRKEYIYFLQNLFESVLWLVNKQDSTVQIEEPDIMMENPIPVTRKELIEENMQAFQAGAQSLETTIRNTNKNASEEWIQAELMRIEAKAEANSSALDPVSRRQEIMNQLNNRNANGILPGEEE